MNVLRRDNDDVLRKALEFEVVGRRGCVCVNKDDVKKADG